MEHTDINEILTVLKHKRFNAD